MFSTTTVRDSFGRVHDYLRISLTERCNLRCLYCMPDSGVSLTSNDQLLSDGEIIRLAKCFISMGINKIRFTGGEPTIRKGIVDIFKEINTMRGKGLSTLAITTNGIVLNRIFSELVDNGLDVVNISLDTLDPLQFQLITRRQGHDRVLASIFKALELKKEKKLRDVKVNCVVMKKINDHEIIKFAELTKDLDLQVRFIEYMPFQGNKWSTDKLVTFETILNQIRVKYKVSRVPDLASETSKTFKIENFAGRLGFISSMSDHFCSTCSRLRLTADGNLKVCLFDSKEISLRDILRSKTLSENQINAQLIEFINLAVWKKKKAHAGMDILATLENRPMITIGG